MKKKLQPSECIEFMICKRVDVFRKGRAEEWDYVIEKVKAEETTIEKMNEKMRELFLKENNYTTTYVLYGRAKRKWFYLNGIN